MADFTISTMYDLSIDKALQNINKLEERLNSLKGVSSVNTPSFSGNNIGINPSSNIVPMETLFRSTISAFEELASVAFRLGASMTALEAFFVHQADEQQKLINNLTSLNAVFFREELNNGTVGMSELSEVSKSLAKDFKDIGNKFGMSSNDIAKMFEKTGLAVRELTGGSVNDILRFTQKMERAMPLMSLTARPDVISREIASVLSGRATSAMPLVYRDITPLTGQTAKDINRMTGDQRFELVNKVLDDLGARTVANTNLISGQWNIFMNNIRFLSGELFDGVQKSVVGVMSEINAFLETEQAKDLLIEFRLAMDGLGSSILKGLDAALGFNQEGVTWEQRIFAMSQALKTGIDVLSSFAEVAGKVFGLLGESISGWSKIIDTSGTIPTEENSWFFGLEKIGKQAETRTNLDFFNNDKSNFSNISQMVMDNLQKGSVDRTQELRDMKANVVHQQVTNNNTITVNLQNDLPPDLIADSVAEAMRRAAMIPKSSSRIDNSGFAMAR